MASCILMDIFKKTQYYMWLACKAKRISIYEAYLSVWIRMENVDETTFHDCSWTILETCILITPLKEFFFMCIGEIYYYLDLVR